MIISRLRQLPNDWHWDESAKRLAPGLEPDPNWTTDDDDEEGQEESPALQCMATTVKGQQCRNTADAWVPGTTLCYTHRCFVRHEWREDGRCRRCSARQWLNEEPSPTEEKPLKPPALVFCEPLYDLGVSFVTNLRASRNLRARMQSVWEANGWG